jgi:hypothetical protein
LALLLGVPKTASKASWAQKFPLQKAGKTARSSAEELPEAGVASPTRRGLPLALMLKGVGNCEWASWELLWK